MALIPEKGNDLGLSKQPESNKIWHLFTGGVSAAISRTITSPLERLRLLRQVSNPVYADLSMIRAMQRFGQLEGIKGFFKGNGLNILRVFPFAGLEFYTFEVCKKYILNEEDRVNKPRLLVSGCIAGAIAMTITYPLDLLRGYASINTSKSGAKVFKEIQYMVRTQGITSLYRGLKISLLGFAPYVGIKMTTFDVLKAKFLPDSQSNNFLLVNLMLGGISAATAITFTYPSDLLKRKLQLLSFSTHKDLQYTGIVDCAAFVMKTEGYRGFFRGLCPTYAKSVPAIAIAFSINERLKVWLGVL